MKKSIVFFLTLCFALSNYSGQRIFAAEEEECRKEEIVEEETDSSEEEESVFDVEKEVLPDEETQKVLDLLTETMLEEAMTERIRKGEIATIGSYSSELARFPSAYQTILKKLHKNHPNWVFVAVDTELDWDTVVAAESSGNRSLVPALASSLIKSNAPGDYDAESGKYIHKDNTKWDAANLPIVGFYMDPRNLLNDTYIWQFEDMTFSDILTEDCVEGILSGTFMDRTNTKYITWLNAAGEKVVPKKADRKTYAQLIYESGAAWGISPMFLASKIRMEVGSRSGSVTGSYTTDNNNVSWSKYNGQSLDGIYNYYNIAANDSAHPITLGLSWAAGYPDKEGNIAPENYSFGRPWNSPILSIYYGGYYITQKYLENGQNTGYFTKFNVTPTAREQGRLYYYQYMTNVSGASSEASTTYSSNLSMGTMDLARVFYIPVFENMPSLTEKPYFNASKQTGTVTGDDSLNMRSQPCINGSIVASIPSGTKVQILEGTIDNTWGTGVYNMELNPYWFKVSATIGGITYTGYVSADFLDATTAKTIESDDTVRLALRETPSQKVFYQSGNPWIATVDQNGVVTGVNAGKTNIYCYTAAGIDVIGVKVKGINEETNISSSRFTVSDVAAQAFTGAAIKPVPVLSKDGQALVKGTDYSVSYSNNILPGTATITLKGKGDYNGSRSVTFKIKGSYAYYVTTDSLNYRTGPGFSYSVAGTVAKGTTVKVLKKSLTTGDGIDWYIVRINDHFYYMSKTYLKKASTCIVTWNANKGTCGTASTKVTIGTTVGTLPVAVRDGYVFQGWYTQKSGGSKISASKTITADVTFYAHWKVDIGGSLVTAASISDKTFNGSAFRPSVTLKKGTSKLVKDTDYTVSYSANKWPGTAVITVKGKGSYAGTRKIRFKIKGVYATYLTTANVNYRKGPGTSYDVVGILANGTTVRVLSGYTKQANGYPWVPVKIGDTHYYMTSTYLQKTTKKITSDSITVASISKKTFTGNRIKPSVTIKDNGTKLVKGTDYTLSYSANLWPGTATVTIQGIGSYTGSRKTTFKIAGTYETYTISVNLNYRTGPGLSYPVAGTFASGSSVKVLKNYSKTVDGYVWVPVYVSGKRYYAINNYFK